MKPPAPVMSFVAVIIMVLISCTIAHATVTVDSVTGKAEVQQAGRFKWEPLSTGAQLHNNDVIRVLEQSRVILRWDENNVLVNANSQIRINILDDERTNIISRHVTIFFGALFFVIKKSIPREFSPTSDVKVYTPTAIVAIRGTMFGVDVDKSNGKTGVSVIDGTVLVRNIIRNHSIFLPAGYRTIIETNTDPAGPQQIIPSHLASYKPWVPAAYLDESLKKASPVPAPAADSIRNTVTVMALENRSGYRGTWEIGPVLAEAIAARLKGTAGVLPVALHRSRADDPLAFGMQSKTRYVIQGTITEFDVSQHAKVTASLDNYSEYSEARVKITLQLIDVVTRSLVYEESFSGGMEDPDIKANAWQELRKLSFDVKSGLIGTTVLGKAVAVVLTNASETMAGYLKVK